MAISRVCLWKTRPASHDTVLYRHCPVVIGLRRDETIIILTLGFLDTHCAARFDQLDPRDRRPFPAAQQPTLFYHNHLPYLPRCGTTRPEIGPEPLSSSFSSLVPRLQLSQRITMPSTSKLPNTSTTRGLTRTSLSPDTLTCLRLLGSAQSARSRNGHRPSSESPQSACFTPCPRIARYPCPDVWISVSPSNFHEGIPQRVGPTIPGTPTAVPWTCHVPHPRTYTHLEGRHLRRITLAR